MAALCAAAAACGAARTIDYRDLAGELERARCERFVRCAVFPDEASCVGYLRAAADTSVAGAIDAGKIRYDGEAASACVDAIARQSCDLTAEDARARPAACDRMLAGAIAGGEPCQIDAECVSGTCEPSSGCPESGCCAGTCRPAQAPAGDGGGCAQDGDCRDGLVCATDRTCRTPAGPGEPCAADRECAAGLGCINPLSTMPGTCRPLPHLGEPCPYLRCADENLRCDETQASCVALGLPGAPCGGDLECSPLLECDATSHACQVLPSLGMPCTRACQGQAFCQHDDTGAGTCVAPLANGAPCEFRSECASYYCFVGPVFESCTDPPACF
ncbi:MAG TPA: hypothetical protein VFK02_13335 [Kofleriaceae bacterium]|nr:hypothetical protein [Kofleriaceae bacterium]